MATEISINTDRVGKFFEDLEGQKKILSSCMQLYKSLNSHFTSLEASLSQKFKSLDSKFLSLDATSAHSLQSLTHREESIPLRENAAAQLINGQKETALADFQRTPKIADLSDSLKSLCRRMDSTGLLKFIISKRKESVTLRAEISRAIWESVDPSKLVLDALEEFLTQKRQKVGVTDKRWACGMLVHAIFPECSGANKAEKALGRGHARRVVERAAGIVARWKEDIGDGELGPAEAVMFLQMVVGFELSSRFDHEFLLKLVLDYASRRDMARLAAYLVSNEKMGDIINELVKSGKEVEAVYFASESGLTNRFNPISLLKSHLRNSKKNATTILKNGNYSTAATEESNNLELNSSKAIIKCVEDHKLESEFSVDNLRKRATVLEKAKVEKKKSSTTNSRPQNKRGHGGSSSRGSGPPAFRPTAKAAKSSNAYHSLSRRNPAPQLQYSPRYSGLYSYPSQSVYEGPSTTHFASMYGAAESQSPVPITQQHYSLPVDSNGAAGFRGSGSYSGQAVYGAYDYSSAPVSYQSSSYTQ